MSVWDIDNNFSQVGTISLPQTNNHAIRGIGVAPNAHILYISFGGDAGGEGNGWLTAYDLVNQQTIWTQGYSHGIDSFAISKDGQTIYMPDGELNTDGKWYVVNASTGVETGTVIDTVSDCGPHNTDIGDSGQYVYFGDRDLSCTGSHYFYGADTTTHQIVRKAGPFQSGIRPFTVDSTETHVYTAITGLLGFQVGDLTKGTNGTVLYTVNLQQPIPNCTPSGSASTPSHGITITPDDKELYVLDYTCNYVHAFDISHIATAAPTQIAAIPVNAFDPREPNVPYDYLGDGWLLTSSSGKYVFVGDSGDVIDTTTHAVAGHISDLYNSRIFIEVDWANGAPSFTTTRSGIGRSTSSQPPAAPTVTISASPTSITTGSSANLTWSSTNASSCTASGGWSGSQPTTGSITVTPTSTTTYSLSCSGSGGFGSNSSVVAVTSPPPSTPSPTPVPSPTPSPSPTPIQTPTPTPSITPSPTPMISPSPLVSGDVNLDGHVNIQDLSILLSHYGTVYDAADFNHDGIVDIVDLSILLSHYGT